MPATYVSGVAERLPLKDGSVDTVLCTLVLCSVTDMDAAAAEMARVLAPGGAMLVLEHVRASTAEAGGGAGPAGPGLAAGLRWLPPQPRPAGGVRPGRVRPRLNDRHLAKLLPLIDPAIHGVAVPR